MRTHRPILLLLCCALVGALPAQGDFLKFDLKNRQATADLDGWALARVLARISADTNWEVMVEPGTELPHPASVRFNRLRVGDALRRLLRGTSYSFVPTESGKRLLVYSSSASAATKSIKGKKSSRIERELAIVLKDGDEEDAKKLAESLGATIAGKIPGQNTYLFRFENDNASLLAREELNRRDDAEVDFNYRATRPTSANAQDASADQFRLKPGAVPDSEKMIIALIDTMVQPNAANNGFLLEPIRIGEGVDRTAGVPTHGTSMFESLMRGLEIATPEAQSESPVRVLPVDVYGAGLNTSTFEVAAGIVAAMNEGASVINLSLGTDENSFVLHDVIKQATERNAVVLAAAGNDASSAAVYPAAYPEATAVTAMDLRGNLASYANYNASVDVKAPGTFRIPFGGKIWEVNGTSAATAFTAGLTAGRSATFNTPAKNAEAFIRSKLSFAPPATP